MFKKGISFVISLVCIWAALCLNPGSGPVFAEEEASVSHIVAPAEGQSEREISSGGGTTTGGEREGHIVCLDPGHQGPGIDMSAPEPDGPGSANTKPRATSGTSGSYTGVPEYALNLDVSLLVRDILEQRGYTVIMTRTDNETAISNRERAQLAGNEGAEIFVRIHANGDSSGQQSGALALCPSAANPYVASLSAESERLSHCILNAYCEVTGFSDLGVQYSDSMTGINWSTVPVTILEMGFMTNEFDDNRMADAEFRQIMAEGIVKGIDAYFGIDTSAAGTKTAVPAGANTSAEAAGTNMTAVPGGNEMDGDTREPQPDAAMRKLLPQIQKGLPRNNGEWAVYVHNMSTGAGACMNSKQMQAASLIKLYIMGAVYENYEEFADAHGKEEVDRLLHAMITVSDNDAANTLTTYLGNGDPDAGLQAVTEYCTTHGYKDSHMGRLLLHSNELDDNYTSVKDCGLFLSRVYANAAGAVSGKERKAADQTPGMPGAKEMFSLLSQQTRTNKIPSRLPEGVRVANKTGELGDVENDAGIIYSTKGGVDLVVCFMSEGVSTPGEAQTAIGDLSLLIYNFYNE